LAVPLCLLYEAAVVFARINDRRKARRSLSAQYAQYDDNETSPLTFDDLDDTPEVGVGSHREPSGNSHYDSDIT
jgi:hypothetical protein